jgi:hypothetical protein
MRIRKSNAWKNLLLASALGLAGFSSFGQPASPAYKTVDVFDLKAGPQRFWARPIVFKDTLTAAPRGHDLGIEGKRFTPFATRVLGAVYAEKTLVPQIAGLDPDREYLFSGTVLNRGRRYYVIAEGFAIPVAAENVSEQMKKLMTDVTAALAGEAEKPLADVVSDAQLAHFAYARDNRLELWQLYDPTNEHFAKALGIVRATIQRQEEKLRMPAGEMLAKYIQSTLSRICPAPAGEVTAAPEAPDLMAPAPTIIEPAEAVEVEEPPEAPRLSWFERRRLAREARRAERAAEIEAVTAAEEEAEAGAPPETTPEAIAAPGPQKPRAAPKPAPLPAVPGDESLDAPVGR